MSFYNDKWVIANVDKEEILLLRKSAKDILLDRIRKDTNITSKETLVQDALEEYDAGIGINNELYTIYQNENMDLIITILRSEGKEDIKLTAEPIPEVIDLNIIINDNKIHIIYLIKIPDEDIEYRIYHHYYEGEDWHTYIVDEIIAKKVLNPIKLIQEEENILIGYYMNDLEIGLKKFDLKKLEWSDPFKLVSSPEEKLYIDMIKLEENIHLAYCEFQEGNLIIRYEKFNYVDKAYEKELEEIVSNEGSPSHPTIIIYENKMWITWIELDNVMSRVGHRDGTNWSDSIYTWDNSRNIDFVRYKYLSVDSEENRILDYSFGSIYPEIEFIGFGSLEKAREVPIKKKLKNLPRI